MALFSAWALVVLAALLAIWCATAAVRLTRRPVRRDRSARVR